MLPSDNEKQSAETLSVSQLNRLARQLLEDCFTDVAVVGEISNLSRPSSGHWYFTLKDQNAQIRCAMFRGRNIAVRFKPDVGQQVLARGKVSLYEGRGDYQLIVDSLQPAGDGALAIAFEQLKRELQAAGLFDAAHKKALPPVIRHVAVITSPTGAAIHDILSTLARRWPALRVSILPVQVQGEAAAGQIAGALQLANRLARDGEQDFDAIIVGRGGGSLEDLWPFNERMVAQAIFDSALPVVSAVGHEIDVTIADFVADVRAATPTAAAELISPDRREVLGGVLALRNRMAETLLRAVAQRALQLRATTARLRHPGQQLRERAQRLDECELRLQRATLRRLQTLHEGLRALQRHLEACSPQRQMSLQQQRLRAAQRQLALGMRDRLQRERTRLENRVQLLRSLGPENTLRRGYAIVTTDDGRLVASTAQLKVGDTVSTRLASGSFTATVETTTESQGA